MSSKQLTNSALGTIIYPLTNGPVAQLGAHHIRIVGVVGSNPIRSTKRKPLFTEQGFLLYLISLMYGKGLPLPNELANKLLLSGAI